MKESYWGYWFLVLGVFVVVILLLVQSYTSTNTQDYYMVKTITEAAMEDAIDYGYFSTYGEAKINKEKFFESFIRRFSEEASIATTYKISFSDIYEAPPKVSVKVTSKSGQGFSVSGDSGDIDIVNRIDAILESSEYVRNVDPSKVTTYRKAIDLATNPTYYLKNGEYSNPCGGSIQAQMKVNNKWENIKSMYCGNPTKELTKFYDEDPETGEAIRFDETKTYCIVVTDNDYSFMILKESLSIYNLTCEP